MLGAIEREGWHPWFWTHPVLWYWVVVQRGKCIKYLLVQQTDAYRNWALHSKIMRFQSRFFCHKLGCNNKECTMASKTRENSNPWSSNIKVNYHLWKYISVKVQILRCARTKKERLLISFLLSLCCRRQQFSQHCAAPTSRVVKKMHFHHRVVLLQQSLLDRRIEKTPWWWWR